MKHDEYKHYSFRWNTSVYMLRKLRPHTGSAGGGEVWTWVNLFKPDGFGQTMTGLCTTAEKCLEEQVKYQKSSGVSCGILVVHENFIDMFTHWVSDGNIEIK